MIYYAKCIKCKTQRKIPGTHSNWTCPDCKKPSIPQGYIIQCPTCCIEFNSTGDEFCPDCKAGIKLPVWRGAYWNG